MNMDYRVQVATFSSFHRVYCELQDDRYEQYHKIHKINTKLFLPFQSGIFLTFPFHTCSPSTRQILSELPRLHQKTQLFCFWLLSF